LLAVLNVTALTSWHTALLVHDDVVADAATLVHDHDGDSEAEFNTGERPDSPAIDLHNLTHAMAHGLTGLVPAWSSSCPVSSAWITGSPVETLRLQALPLKD
jgi:hypothetical protein